MRYHAGAELSGRQQPLNPGNGEIMSGDLISIEDQMKMKPIFSLENALLELPQIDLPLAHDFCNGIYARTIIIPQGTCLTGSIHRDECFFVVREGFLVMTTGDQSIQVGPGYMAVSPAHSKRAGIALTNVVCTTFHANPQNEENPDTLWDMITIPAPESLLEDIQ